MSYSSNANRPTTGLFTLDKCVVPFAKKNGDTSQAVPVFFPKGSRRLPQFGRFSFFNNAA